MEPKLPSPNMGPEVPSVNYGQNSEHTPAFPSQAAFERAPERVEQHGESALAAAAAAPILPPPVMPAPASSIVPDATSVGVSDDDLPIVANDDDLIEKEWVDKAKKIIIQTKDDPYRREQEVNKLQADYLQKRYGRELGASQ
jgi:hypothetical protein